MANATGCVPDCRDSPLAKSRVGNSRESGPQFRDRVAAEEPFFGDRAIAVVDRHFRGLVGSGQSNRLGDCLFAARKSAPRVIFSFLCHCPTLLGRMNPIKVASQHHGFLAVVSIDPRTTSLPGVFPQAEWANSPT